MKGGIKRKVKYLMYEVIPGFWRENCIYDAVWELEGMEKRAKIKSMYDCVKMSLPTEWSQWIKSECADDREDRMPELFVMEEGAKCEMKSLSVKKGYALLTVVLKDPASEKVEYIVFEGFDLKKIWSNVNIKYNRIECENNDFMIRHNRLYTNVVFHNINRDVSPKCDVCSSGHESMRNWRMFYVSKRNF